jgi:hypothetical protein
MSAVIHCPCASAPMYSKFTGSRPPVQHLDVDVVAHLGSGVNVVAPLALIEMGR